MAFERKEIANNPAIEENLQYLINGWIEKDRISSASTATTLDTGDILHVNSGNVDVTIPKAAAANKGKMFAVYATNASGATVKDSAANTIVALAQNTGAIMFSMGDTAVADNGYAVFDGSASS